MNSLITAFLIGSIITAVVVLFMYLWNVCKDKYKSYKAYKHSDKRTFDCSEVVWFNKHKFYIESVTKWSHTLDIDLTLRPVKYNLSFLETKVDSREVKKVVRMQAQLGNSEYSYYSTIKGCKFNGIF